MNNCGVQLLFGPKDKTLKSKLSLNVARVKENLFTNKVFTIIFFI
jgi:hypothetical protein